MIVKAKKSVWSLQSAAEPLSRNGGEGSETTVNLREFIHMVMIRQRPAPHGDDIVQICDCEHKRCRNAGKVAHHGPDWNG